MFCRVFHNKHRISSNSLIVVQFCATIMNNRQTILENCMDGNLEVNKYVNKSLISNQLFSTEVISHSTQ